MNPPEQAHPDAIGAMTAQEIGERILTAAIERSVSDVHLQVTRTGVIVRFRDDGKLHDFETLSSNTGLRVIRHLKVLADMDIANQRRPQEGRLLRTHENRSVDLRGMPSGRTVVPQCSTRVRKGSKSC